VNGRTRADGQVTYSFADERGDVPLPDLRVEATPPVFGTCRGIAVRLSGFTHGIGQDRRGGAGRARQPRVGSTTVTIDAQGRRSPSPAPSGRTGPSGP